ncbi:16900_t:CDS:2 [Racocetra fulgida]|uniref:16900_t:CDS:1 n=1 Tax=Racocetra fulgida TaxID=60492 RepID=A0A9N9CQB8_9GLOM|nr:16900_t:CDS:2 [Racocetra fulgida]
MDDYEIEENGCKKPIYTKPLSEIRIDYIINNDHRWLPATPNSPISLILRPDMGAVAISIGDREDGQLFPLIDNPFNDIFDDAMKLVFNLTKGVTTALGQDFVDCLRDQMHKERLREKLQSHNQQMDLKLKKMFALSLKKQATSTEYDKKQTTSTEYDKKQATSTEYDKKQATSTEYDEKQATSTEYDKKQVFNEKPANNVNNISNNR